MGLFWVREAMACVLMSRFGFRIVAEPRWRCRIGGSLTEFSEEATSILRMGLAIRLAAQVWRKLFQLTAVSVRMGFLQQKLVRS